MQIDRPSRFWTVLGKLALLVTVIVGLMQGWHLIFPERVGSSQDNSSARIVGTLKYAEFQMPPDIVNQIETARKLNSQEKAEEFIQSQGSAIFDKFLLRLSSSVDDLLSALLRPKQFAEVDPYGQFLAKHPDSTQKLKNALNELLMPVLRDYARSAWDSKNLYSLPNYESYVLLNVENVGQKQATNAEVHLPYKGLFVLEAPGEKLGAKSFDGKIALGNILPKTTIVLRLWTLNAVSSYSWELERWSITYVDGVGTVRLGN